VVGLDWRLEGEHIHPGDIAPILERIPPPDGLLKSPLWPGARPHWRRFTGLIAGLTSQASARQGGDFAAGDRTALHLPPEQVALIRAVAGAQPRVVVALMGGGAILTGEWDQLVPGLLLLWYPGEQGGHGLAEVLFGQVSPSGQAKARFGEGESGEVELAVSVRNEGAMAAAEVVQVYLEPPGLLMERPERVLVAFQRVELGPGESRRLTLTIPARRLACFDSDRDSFVWEAGPHRLVVAPHAEAPGPAVTVELEARVLGP